MQSLNGSFQTLADLKDAREAADVMRRIVDVNVAERIRVLRESEKQEDVWLATAAGLLEDLDRQRRELDAVYAAGVRLVDLNHEELVSEALRLKIPLERVREYQKNSLLLGRIATIKDYAAAAAFLTTVVGVNEIGSPAYKEALRVGKEITAERRKSSSGELFNEEIARRMIPVLLRCEYPDGNRFVQRYFLALHDSFARKVLQDVKEHLRKLFPSFSDMVAEMQTKITVEEIHDFLFAREGNCLIALAKAHVWSDDARKRSYAVLLERRVREDKIEMLDVVSAGDGPDELVAHIGEVFRYKVYGANGEAYPELRNVRDNCHPLFRFLIKVLRDSGWEIPTEWPRVPYPNNWKNNW